MQADGKGFRFPAAVTLRECSVVIVGSTCKICGRDFKCESDVALHTRWRHNAAMGSLMNILDHEMSLGDVGQKCDICDMTFGIVSDLRIHKRLIHKHGFRKGGKRRRESGTVRVRFKLNGETTTDVTLDRRYIKTQNSPGYFVDVCTQSLVSLKNERRQDDCAGNIDLSLPNHIVDKSHMQHDIRPDKAANRYIVGKFASIKGDAIARRAVVMGKGSLVEISNSPLKNAVPVSDSSCEGHKDRCYFASQQTAADVFFKTFANGIDVCDEENSRIANEREKRNVYCQSDISLIDEDAQDFLNGQPETSDKPPLMFKQNSSSESPRYSIRWSDKVAGTKETAGLANSLIDSVEIIINQGKSYGLDEDTTAKRLSPPLSRFNKKTESIRADSNVDDDVQEVLRITRGNAQSDINHESPNRMEREMLVQNTISDTFTLPSTVYPEKCNVAFRNFEPSDYSSFMTMTESDYQFLSNSFDKKLGIYLEDLHHYGITLYNELPEINNNLEEYSVYAHQDFFEIAKQSSDPMYISELNELKTNDNEVAVVID